MVERYAHLSDDHKRAAIDSMQRGKMVTVSTTSEKAVKSELLQVVEK